MNRIVKAGLVATALAAIPGGVRAQSAVAPLQRGVSVQQPVTTHAVAVPDADRQDALVVALTADGSLYLGADRLSTDALADRVRRTLSARDDRTLYLKADAHVPYARLVEVIDAVWKSGVEGVTLLTAQHDASDQGTRPVPPKGLALRIAAEGK